MTKVMLCSRAVAYDNETLLDRSRLRSGRKRWRATVALIALSGCRLLRGPDAIQPPTGQPGTAEIARTGSVCLVTCGRISCTSLRTSRAGLA